MRSLIWILIWTAVLAVAEEEKTLDQILDWDHMLYGVGSGVMCFGTVLDISRNDQFANSLNAMTTSSETAEQQHWGTRKELFWIRVGGIPELLRADSVSNNDGTHKVTLYHVKRFFTMSSVPFNRFNAVAGTFPAPGSKSSNVVLLTLSTAVVDDYWFMVEYDDSKYDDELFAHSKGTAFKEKILLERVYEEVNFVGFERIKADKLFEIPDLRNWKVDSILKAQTGMVGGASTTVQAATVGGTNVKYYQGPNYHMIKLLYKKRRHLIDAIYPMTFSNFHYVMGNGERNLTGQNTVRPLLKGSTVMIVRNGWLCAIKVVKEKYLADIVYRMREIYPCDPDACINKALQEQVFLASATGEETIALVTTPSMSYYGLYNTRPSASTNHACYKLDRTKMIQVPELKGRIRGMDFNPSEKTVVVSVNAKQTFKMNIADWRSGGGAPTDIKTWKTNDLDLTDHFTGEPSAFSSTPTKLPWQIFNTHKLMRTEEKIQWLLNGNKNAAQTLATYSAESVDYMLYFTDVVADASWKRENVLFGLKGCTLFAGGSPEDLVNMTAQYEGCKFKDDDGNELQTKSFLEQPKDDAGFMTLTWLVEDSKTTANVFQTRIAIPREEKQFTLDLTKEDAWKKETITFRLNTFNMAFVKNDEVHYNVDGNENKCMFEKLAIGSGKPPVKYDPHIADCEPDQLKNALVDASNGQTFSFLDRKGKLTISSKDEESLNKMNVKKMESGTDTRYPLDAIPASISNGLFAYRTVDKYFALTDLYNEDNKIWELKNVRQLRSIGFYNGPFYQARSNGEYKCILTNCHKSAVVTQNELVPDPPTPPVSLKPFAEFDIEEVAVGVEQKEHKRMVCSTSKRPFFVAFVVKAAAVDLLLTLVFVSILLVHRMYIIPARRRFKIVSSVMKNRKKRALKKRATRRLKKLNLLRRRMERASKKKDGSGSSSSSENSLVTAADNPGALPPPDDNAAPNTTATFTQEPSSDVSAMSAMTTPVPLTSPIPPS